MLYVVMGKAGICHLPHAELCHVPRKSSLRGCDPPGTLPTTGRGRREGSSTAEGCWPPSLGEVV